MSMLERRGGFIAPEDITAAVRTRGAVATREELVRLMAERWRTDAEPLWSPRVTWEELAWTLEQTARGL